MKTYRIFDALSGNLLDTVEAANERLAIRRYCDLNGYRINLIVREVA